MSESKKGFSLGGTIKSAVTNPYFLIGTGIVVWQGSKWLYKNRSDKKYTKVVRELDSALKELAKDSKDFGVEVIDNIKETTSDIQGIYDIGDGFSDDLTDSVGFDGSMISESLDQEFTNVEEGSTDGLAFVETLSENILEDLESGIKNVSVDVRGAFEHSETDAEGSGESNTGLRGTDIGDEQEGIDDGLSGGFNGSKTSMNFNDFDY
tara:strand:+ start:5533 stop:6156 length:624 start_codon:yes stop_codon:yes gene_type:complete